MTTTTTTQYFGNLNQPWQHQQAVSGAYTDLGSIEEIVRHDRQEGRLTTARPLESGKGHAVQKVLRGTPVKSEVAKYAEERQKKHHESIQQNGQAVWRSLKDPRSSGELVSTPQRSSKVLKSSRELTGTHEQSPRGRKSSGQASRTQRQPLVDSRSLEEFEESRRSLTDLAPSKEVSPASERGHSKSVWVEERIERHSSRRGFHRASAALDITATEDEQLRGDKKRGTGRLQVGDSAATIRKGGLSSRSRSTKKVDGGLVGGRARREAAAKVGCSLHRFDQRIQAMLREESGGVRPRGYAWYRCDADEGYLCGGGNHFVRDTAVDQVLYGKVKWVHITLVNQADMSQKLVAPPKDGWHEPMHWNPAKREANDMDLVPLKADGTPHGGVEIPSWHRWHSREPK